MRDTCVGTLLVHPGTQNAFRLAAQLHRHACLGRSRTGIAFPRGGVVGRIASALPGRFRRQISGPVRLLRSEVLPNRPIPVRIWRGPFRHARIMMNRRDSLREVLGLYEHQLNLWLEQALCQVARVMVCLSDDGQAAPRKF